MAERRMFSKSIVDSDVFLDMPLSTQALYFHLSMRADDEGFINNPKKIMRMIGAAQNELEILLAKRYLLSFDSGVVVVKHWKIHNYIQNDRFKETLYKEERDQVGVKENKSYTEVKNLMDTECIHDGDTGKIRLGKSKVRKEESSREFLFFDDYDFQCVWKDYLEVRTKKKASKSDRAVRAILSKLVEYSKNDKQVAIEIIRKSADSGWSDIYALKSEEKKKIKKTTQILTPWVCDHGGVGEKTQVSGKTCVVCGESKK